jgi:hypothetical protein
MTNPYAPPETPEDHPAKDGPSDRRLRWLGALTMIYLSAGVAMREPIMGHDDRLAGLGLMAVFIYGFLRGGRKFQLGIALLMAISIPTQAYFVHRSIALADRLPVPLSPHPWRELAVAIIPHSIALVCSAMLYFRARRGTLR